MRAFLNMTWTGLAARLALRCIAHPSLALDLLCVSWRFRSRDWYRRPPFLPIPDQTYMEWRMYTAFGDHHAMPSADDVARYARWASRIP
jgi:hypothetical protein